MCRSGPTNTAQIPENMQPMSRSCTPPAPGPTTAHGHAMAAFADMTAPWLPSLVQQGAPPTAATSWPEAYGDASGWQAHPAVLGGGMVFLYPNQMQMAAAPVFPVASSGAAPPQPSPMPAAAHMQSGAPMPSQPYPTSMQLQAPSSCLPDPSQLPYQSPSSAQPAASSGAAAAAPPADATAARKFLMPVNLEQKMFAFSAERQQLIQELSGMQPKSKAARPKGAKTKAAAPPKATAEPSNLREMLSPTTEYAHFDEEKREVLCEYIHNFMTGKGMDSPGGYLVVDVLSNVWRDLFSRYDPSMTWKIGKQRFITLLRSAPKYFEVLEVLATDDFNRSHKKMSYIFCSIQFNESISMQFLA